MLDCVVLRTLEDLSNRINNTLQYEYVYIFFIFICSDIFVHICVTIGLIKVFYFIKYLYDNCFSIRKLTVYISYTMNES